MLVEVWWGLWATNCLENMLEKKNVKQLTFKVSNWMTVSARTVSYYAKLCELWFKLKYL